MLRRPFCPPLPIDFTIILPLCLFMALTELTTSTTSSQRSFLATFPLTSYTSTAGTSPPPRDLAAPARSSIEPPSSYRPASIPTAPEPAVSS
jgi:hypothetical protein